MLGSEEATEASKRMNQQVLEHINRQSSVSEAEKEKARGLTPEVRRRNEAELNKIGVNLKQLETSGYTPFMAGDGSLTVLPVDMDKGYLLVNDVNEVAASQGKGLNPEGEPKRYVVLGGKVDKRVYMEWKQDPDGGEGWHLVDKRGGQVTNQSMRPDIRREGSFYPRARLDHHDVTNPSLPWGHSITMETPLTTPSKTEVAEHKAWVKQLIT